MLPVAELPFLAEREILGEIELQIWASQDWQDGPDHQMRCQYRHEHDAGSAAGVPDQPVKEAVGCRSRASGLGHGVSALPRSGRWRQAALISRERAASRPSRCGPLWTGPVPFGS